MATPKVLLKRSSVSSNAPDSSDLEYGELAINFADGRIYYKNSSNEVKNFVDSDILYTAMKQLSTDSAEVASIVTATVDKAFVDALGINATQLQSQAGSYYLDYGNFTNTPTVLDSALTTQLVDSAYVQLRQTSGGLDSALTTQLIDSAYVRLRQLKTFGLAGNSGSHTYNTETETLTFLGQTGQINAEIAANNVSLTLDQNINSITSVAFEGDSANTNETKVQAVNPTKDNTINLPDSSGTIALLTDITGGGGSGLDSALVSQLIDSSYIQLRQTDVGLDSSLVSQLVDSSYIQLRQTDVGLDSGLITQLIDSAYTQLRVSNQGLRTTDSVTFAGLTVAGTTTTVHSDNLRIKDPLIHLADSQTVSDMFDIGFIGHYSESANGPSRHTGLVRDASNSQYYLFNGLVQDGLDSTDNFIQVGGTDWALANLNAANITAEGVTVTNNVVSTGTITGTDVTAAHMDSVDYIGFTSSGTVNLAVTVAAKTDQHRYTSDGSGSAYYIDGKESPFLLLSPGNTYRFTLSSSDMTSHPFRFYLDAAKLTAYTTNVTSTSTYTEITITDATPHVLHYQCSSHGYMGNSVNTQSRGQIIDSAVITSLMPKTGVDFADSSWIVSQIPVTGTDFADSSWIISQIPVTGTDFADSSWILSQIPKTGVDFADSSWIVANFLDSALTTQLIDSAYIQDRQSGGGGGTVDSAYVESVSLDSERTQLLINATYIQARQSLLDSSLTSQLIDSAYVSARAGAGTDSAAVIQLIDSAYVQARGEGAAPFELTNFRYNADSGQTSFTGVDVNGRTLAVDSGKLQVFLNGILLADSDFSHNTSKVDLLVAADSADILTVVKMDGNNTISNFQSKHFIFNADSGQTVFTGADRSGQVLTYSNTDRTNVYLNGILLTNDSDFTATNGSTVTLTVGADSADVLDINVFRGSNISSMDSAAVQLIVDSAYVQLHAKGLDYGVLTNTPLSGVDSAEVIKLITANAIDSGVALQLLLDSIETINLIDSSHVQLHAVGLDYNRLSNLPTIPVTGTDFADSAWIISQIPVTGTDFADSSWILSQLPKTGVDFADSSWIVANFLDSALTTQLIDSSYIQLRQSASGGGLDSALTTQLIDSAYVQLRQTAGGGGSGTVDSAYVEANSLDSERTKLLIDSDYILARVTNTQPGEYNNDRTEFTVGGADSGRLVFDTQKALNLVAGNTEVYLNGILQLSGTDYTVDSSAVTFTAGVAANHQVTVLERAGKILTQRGLVENVFAYTTAAPTTSITGSDDKGATLDVSEGYADVFLNGILLRDSDDYSINDAGTILTLVSATDSSDIVTVKNSKGVIVTPQVKRFEYTTAAPATTISGSDLHSNTLAYSPGSLQVHVNGILLQEKNDFTATTGNSVLLTTATDSGDDVTVSAFSAPGSKLELYKFTADSGQTVFSGNDAAGRFMSYEPGNIQVFLNGLLLNDSDDYTASNTKAVRLLTAAALNDELKVASFETTSEITRSNTWTAPTGTVSAAAGDKLFIDTSGGARTVTLPSSATMGDEIRIIDATGNAASNNITVSRNGHNIHGASSDLVINIARAGIGLAYFNVAQGWLLIEN